MPLSHWLGTSLRPLERIYSIYWESSVIKQRIQ